MPAHTRAASAREGGRPDGAPAALTIVPLHPRLVAPAIDVLARAYATNPINRRVFGTQVLERNRTFFGEALAALRGAVRVALLDGEVVGVAHWVASPACRIPPPNFNVSSGRPCVPNVMPVRSRNRNSLLKLGLA